jgi:hypothetical protein
MNYPNKVPGTLYPSESVHHSHTGFVNDVAGDFWMSILYLLNKQGSDLSGAPVKKFARQKCRMAHLTGLVYPQ